MSLLFIVLLCTLFSVIFCSSSSSIDTCRQVFASDKELMKQMYLKENKHLDAKSVMCDSWGCHNCSTYNCCYNGNCEYDDAWWGWGTVVFVLFGFCLFFFLIIFVIGALAWPYSVNCQDTPVNQRYYREGTVVLLKENK